MQMCICMKPKTICKWALFLAFLMCPCLAKADDIKMSEIKALTKLSVNEILQNTPVKEIDHATYWETVKGSSKPVVVMFYSNLDQPSRNLATLVRFIAVKYPDKIIFLRFMVVKKGNPDRSIREGFEKKYSLDKTPGILFYDNDTGKMELESEEYIIPAFKEYRIPGYLLWKTYYSKVISYIDKYILD